MIFPWKRQWWYKSFCVNHNDYDSILESYVKQIGCPKGCHETWLENPAFAADCPSQNFHVWWHRYRWWIFQGEGPGFRGIKGGTTQLESWLHSPRWVSHCKEFDVCGEVTYVYPIICIYIYSRYLFARNVSRLRPISPIKIGPGWKLFEVTSCSEVLDL